MATTKTSMTATSKGLTRKLNKRDNDSDRREMERVAGLRNSITQLEQQKAEARGELEMLVIGLINKFVLDNCGKEIACMSRGQFVVPDLVKESLNTLIETVYQARTEEIMKIAEGRKATINPTDDDHTFYNKQSWNASLTDLIATLKDTKISKE